MLEIKKGKLGDMVTSIALHDYLELRKDHYSRWLKKHIINNLYADEGKDYNIVTQTELKHGNFRKDYELHVDFALKLCMVSNSPVGETTRNELVDLNNQKKNLDLFTADEIIHLSKLKAVFSYVAECEKAKKINMGKFVDNSNSKNPYGEFHVWRNEILKLDKGVIDERLKNYCIENHRQLPKSKKQIEKLIVIDKYEVLRNGVWDFLTASNEKHAMKLANLVKDMAEAENLAIRRVNEFDLMNKKKDLPKLNK
jgi:phage anti-repressor protein